MQHKLTEARELALKSVLTYKRGIVPWRFIMGLLKMFDDDVDQDTVEKNLRKIEAEPWPVPGSKIKISHHGVELGFDDAAQVDQRAREQEDIKQLLSIALWDFLLGRKDAEAKSTSRFSVKVETTDTLDAKLAALRKKHMPSVWIDAGSTTAEAMRQLLSAKAFPMGVPDPDDGSAVRLIRPIIHTNSLSVVNAIEQHSRHRSSIKVRIVGGELQMDHKNVSGVLSDTCLDSWHLRGDIAILGATGLSELLGTRTFCCDGHEEAHLKTRFLEACWFRVIVADSSKFGTGTVNQSFVPLAGADLDLVVTDDGSKTGNEEKIRAFAEEAKKKGVGCLILKPSSPRRAS
ncbi:MAG TPA: hypothetical protein VGE39_17950 [Prosthecobacter sp.]